MAEERVFTLVGNFTDNITPRLNAVNSSLTRLTAQMERLRAATQPLKNDFRQLAADSKLFGDGLSRQVSDLRRANTALRDHARELGRVNRAYRAGAGRQMPGAVSPSGGGGGGRGGYGGGANWGAAVGGSVFGNQLANVMTGAIVRGFQMGTNLMRIPFNYFMNAFSERIQDESSDIQSAGGLLAISQRKNLNMFADFQAAVKTQQAINYRLAKSAAALPGSTQEYVQQGKRISDSIMTAMGANAPGMQKFAEELGAKQGDKIDALGLLIQKFTEKSVLLGQGVKYQGAYGVPQLIEMLMNTPRVSEQMFQRFAVYRDMPILQSAFRDMQKQLAQTGAYTQERMKLVFKLLDQALPNQVIQAHKNSMAGFLEAFRSAFLDPETGLFGVGRKLKEVAPQVDQFGKFLENKKNADLSLYDLIRDTLTGFGLPLSELASILPQIYEPFAKIIPNLVNLRNVAQQFYYTFNRYTKDYEIIAENFGLGTKLGRSMKESAGARGALTAIANLLVNFEKLPTAKFTEIVNKLKDPKFTDFGNVAKELFSALFDSKAMRQIGGTLGQMVGGTLAELGSLMGGITGTTSAGPFAAGLKAGWDQAGGTQGVVTIFRSLFGLILNVLKEAITKAPVESLVIGGALLAPSIISGLLTTLLVNSLGGRGGGGGRGGMGALSALAPFFSAPGRGRLEGRTGVDFIRRARIYGAGLRESTIGESAYMASGLRGAMASSGVGRLAGRAGRYVPGAAVAGGALELGMSLASGESVGKSIAGAVGTTLGGVLGSTFGPVGTMIGMTAGSYLGSLVYDVFNPAAREQKEASQRQVEASAAQLQAAKLRQIAPTPTPMEVNSQVFGAILRLSQAPGAPGAGGAFSGLSATAVETIRQRNLAQDLVDKTKREREVFERGLAGKVEAGTPQYERVTKRYNDAVATAENNLRVRQAAFDKSFAALPVKVQDVVVSKLATMSTTKIEEAAADLYLRSGGINAAYGARQRTLATNVAYEDYYQAEVRAGRKPVTRDQFAHTRWSGGLGDAISQEMRHKPPGSNLVIANSSETIIPAAGGLGMKDFMRTLDTGFNRVAGTVQASVQNGYAGGAPITNHISIVQQPGQDPEELAAIVAMKIGEAVAERRSASIFI